MFKSLALLVLSGALIACQNPRFALEALAETNHYQISEQTLARLPIIQLSPIKTSSLESVSLRVYIEGDGRAWITQSQPSLDPTPHNFFFAKLAMHDVPPSIYLGRPCQFVRNESCTVYLWTSARFGQQTLTAMHLALDKIRDDFKVQRFELIGYSGGAAIALLLTAQRDDVEQVQTIAGNLSPKVWAQFHQLTALDQSQDPTSYATQLQSIKQRHFVGELDKNISLPLFYQFMQSFSPQAECVELVEVKQADHAQGWNKDWQARSHSPIHCMSKSELLR